METTKQQARQVLDGYGLDGTPISCERYGGGHINGTFLVQTDCGHRYVIQRINDAVFPDTKALMANVEGVTGHIARKVDDPRRVLRLVRTKQGASWLRLADGTPWRVLEFVEGSVCLQQPRSAQDFYCSGVAFGTFLQQLHDYPAHTLTPVIPNFHDTRDRYRQFHEALERNAAGRADTVAEEIAFALAREHEAGQVVDLLAEGKLPLRVTHNDTKLNNVMLDEATGMPLCVIDLDTVMPGSSLYDYGDSIRFGASTATEDETDLDRVEMDLAMYEAYTRGFVEGCPDLTELERELLPVGAKLMTLECGVRFLTDYLNGDVYFSIHRPDHNLDRCRTQFKLVADMEAKWQQMGDIARRLCAR
ncbi:MAG: aminoglycoside phosphotransferase family protein [Oscillospiraceae bacterium]|nr:aminoglycoside phosphotransferase family protein [Oscillospiraceae bacterium]